MKTLSEQDIILLDEKALLDDFAKCTPYSVFQSIYDYINYDGFPKNPKVKFLIERAFADKIRYCAFRQDYDLIECITRVKDYKLSTKYGNKTIGELKKVISDIDTICSNSTSNNTKSSSQIGDIKKRILISDVISVLQGYTQTNDPNRKQIVDLVRRLKLIETTYLTSMNERTTSETLINKIHRTQEDLNLIRDGVSYLISKMSEGYHPSYWRTI